MFANASFCNVSLVLDSAATTVTESVTVATPLDIVIVAVVGVFPNIPAGSGDSFHRDSGPVKPILTGDEMEEIARRVQDPKDQTPKYNPEHILSPEFSGTSNYESGIIDLMEKAKQKLARLLNDPESTQQEIELAKLDLTKLNYLYDNFHMGMNVFRTAKGGRDTLRE